MKKLTKLITSAFLATTFYTQAALIINEVCYKNSVVEDENGDASSDWIELYNSGPLAVNVNNYAVGDQNPYQESKGVRLPDYTIPPGGFMLIYANSDLPEGTVWKQAPDFAAIPENSGWKYWNEHSAPGANWRESSYPDSSWSEGVSPLGHNTTRQSMDCATVLGNTDVPSSLRQTIYFRAKFTVLKPSVVTGLVMRARFKDGGAVYLNGTEIHRDNLPQGALTYQSLALSPVSSTAWIEKLCGANALVQGENTLAIEVHKAAADGAAIIMDLSLTALVDEQIPFVHGDFGLKKEGENAHLFNSYNIRINECEAPTVEIGDNNSWGAVVDGDGSSFQIYYKPTPGLPNATYNTKYQEDPTLPAPSFSLNSGFYSTARNINLSASVANQKVYYTLDGSDPRESASYVASGNSIELTRTLDITSGLAWNRTNPVEIGAELPLAEWRAPVGSIDKAIVLRAVAVSADGKRCSTERKGTYFIGSGYSNRSLPVFALITDTESLCGFVDGLYLPGKFYADSPEGYGDNKWGKPHANYHQDNTNLKWERPVFIELFETSQNTPVIAAGMGFAIHGGGSRAIPQKTLYMHARNSEYGVKYINYQLFPQQPATQYKRFLLRNSGNDWYGAASSGETTMMRDAIFHEISAALRMSTMAARPALVYINGEYWGIHNLRESLDKHYLATRYNIDPDNADILSHVEADNSKIEIKRVDGDKRADNEYQEMLEWIQVNSPANEANYQQITNKIDPDNYRDYIIAETFFANTDWPQNNCDFWRAHSNQVDVAGAYGDQRWRWMLYDLDVAGEKGAAFNMFDYLSHKSMTGKNEPAFLINQLWQNSNFRISFISRYADLLNTTFHPNHTAEKTAASAARIASEIERHFRRWGRATTRSEWQNCVNSHITQYLANRHSCVWTHINSHFELSGTGSLTVKNANPDGSGGYLRVNSLDIKTSTDGVENRAQWSGAYFQGIAVKVEAIAESGYEFDGWEGTTIASAQRSLYVGAFPITVVARFRAAGTPPRNAVNFERWQLNNYSEQEIIAGSVCAPNAPSGEAGMSNLELYAFGMNIDDGLTDAQRLARASLSINAENSDLFVGYNRLDSSHNDLTYALKTADTLCAPIAWRNVVAGEDLLLESLTNLVDESTWFYQRKLNHRSPDKKNLFFKLEVKQR